MCTMKPFIAGEIVTVLGLLMGFVAGPGANAPAEDTFPDVGITFVELANMPSLNHGSESPQ